MTRMPPVPRSAPPSSRYAHRLLRIGLVALLCVLLLGGVAVAGAASTTQAHASRGTRYDLQAHDVWLTTRQVGAYQRSGTLAQQIADRAHLLVRVLPYLEVYEGLIEGTDVSTMRDASQTQGEQTYRVTFTVDAADPAAGEIVVAVTVAETLPTMLESSAPGSVLFPLFKAPFPGTDPGGTGNTKPPAGLPTEVAPPGGGSTSHGPTQLAQAPRPAATTSASETESLAQSEPSNQTPKPAMLDADRRSLLQRFIDKVNEYGTEGWLALCLEAVTLSGVVPVFVSSIAGDVGVLRWHERKKIQLRAERGNAFA